MTAPLPAGCVVTADRLIALATQAQADLSAGRAHSDTGGLSGARQGKGGDIYDLRPYQQGDDPRHIDAAATARSGRVQIRRRHDEADRTVLLVADFRPPMLWGTRGRLRSVAAAEALALAGWQTVLAGGRVGSVAVGGGEVETRPPRLRNTAMIGIAQSFSRVHDMALTAAPAKIAPLGAVLARAAPMLRPGGTMILATGFDAPGEGFAAAADAVMRTCRLEILLVQDPVEIAPPAHSVAMRMDGEVVQARFGRSGHHARLDALGISTRIIRTDAGARP